VLNDYGYVPAILLNNGLPWFEHSLMCKVNDEGRPAECGYGCKNPDAGDYCIGGCKIPGKQLFNQVATANFDPFVEFNGSNGFRGYDGACDRSCQWWATVKDVLPAVDYVSAEERVAFDTLCAIDPTYGFAGRALVDKDALAPEGALYWWNGQKQYFPNKDYQSSALEYAQTAYFISIIVVQWADLLIAKTRKLSCFEQGLGNDFMNFGLVFETILGATLIYTGFLNQVFGTRPLHILHWFPGVPWSMLIFIYDEVRKYLMRQSPDGWLDRFTYW